MQSIVSTAGAPPKRQSPANTVICIRLKQRYALAVDSRFELHSVSGYRLQNGALQVERIAGFCHLRNSLKTYWLDQLESVRSVAGDAIGDLSAWLAARQAEVQEEPAGTPHDALAIRAASEPKRHAGSVSRSIDRAIEAAAANGFTDIADRLRGIRTLLPNIDLARTI